MPLSMSSSWARRSSGREQPLRIGPTRFARPSRQSPMASREASSQPQRYDAAGDCGVKPRSTLSIPENPNPVAEVSPLQTPEVTPGQRDHRSRLQNRLYPAVQTIRDVMDHKWRASDLGPARDEAESGLGSGPSEVLGLKTDAGGVTRNAQSRSARATRRIGLWAESDYPRRNPSLRHRYAPPSCWIQRCQPLRSQRRM